MDESGHVKQAGSIVTDRDGTAQLNVQGCPQLKDDLCAAYADLAQAYRNARVPLGAQWAAGEGRERYGCAIR